MPSDIPRYGKTSVTQQLGQGFSGKILLIAQLRSGMNLVADL
ncbi:hypothetical protein SOW02_04680 [Pectobacterium actinidiae]|nr:hypothetical protein [Pectobacterium actinidiae]MDY4314234.1 hypothetical protein [Pectobacterium actinidiae]